MLVRLRRELDGYEEDWKTAREQVERERQASGRLQEEASLAAHLASLSETELREVLSRVPEAVLKRLM